MSVLWLHACVCVWVGERLSWGAHERSDVWLGLWIEDVWIGLDLHERNGTECGLDLFEQNGMCTDRTRLSVCLSVVSAPGSLNLLLTVVFRTVESVCASDGNCAAALPTSKNCSPLLRRVALDMVHEAQGIIFIGYFYESSRRNLQCQRHKT